MEYTISVDNIKCGGCARTIEKSLLKIESIQKVSVNIEEGLVTVEGETIDKENLAKTLLSLGYPESGSTEGISSLTSKAKSFVSCAIGRMDKDKE